MKKFKDLDFNLILLCGIEQVLEKVKNSCEEKENS